MSAKEFLAEFVIAMLIFALVIWGIYVYGNHQFELGKQAERGAWFARDNEELVAANAKIKTLEEQYRQQEHDAADAIAVISANYQKDLKNAHAEKDRVIADIRGGVYRLRIPIAAPVPAFGNPASAVAAAPGRCDAGARAELSVEASEFGSSAESVGRLFVVQATLP